MEKEEEDATVVLDEKAPEESEIKVLSPILIPYISCKFILVILFLIGLFSQSFTVLQWTISILSSSISFWLTYTLFGKRLVGLRFYNDTDRNGGKWVFKDAPNDFYVSQKQRKTFWNVLAGDLVVYMILLLIALIRLELSWMLISIFEFTLAFILYIGYARCDGAMKSSIIINSPRIFTSIFVFLLNPNIEHENPIDSRLDNSDKGAIEQL